MPDLAPVVVPAGVTGQNAAWAVVPSRLDPAALRQFCLDVERLFRINPYLELSTWSEVGANRYHMRWRNLSNQQFIEMGMRVEALDDGLLAVYDSGLKQSTRFHVSPTDNGSTLTIIDDYGEVTEEEAVSRLAEVDKSLTAWGEALRAYLLQERRWGNFAPYRWYRRLWLRLKPSTRRITMLLILFTLAEIVFLSFAVLIYRIEFG